VTRILPSVALREQSFSAGVSRSREKESRTRYRSRMPPRAVLSAAVFFTLFSTNARVEYKTYTQTQSEPYLCVRLGESEGLKRKVPAANSVRS
jgi:hypothetical protein